jgi:hypothetical protein
MEGTTCLRSNCDPNQFILPVDGYDHDHDCAITGGYVYRGSMLPSLSGKYIFGDYCSGRIWTTVRGADGQFDMDELIQLDGQLTTFAEDDQGEMLVADFSGGAIYRLVPDPAG